MKATFFRKYRIFWYRNKRKWDLIDNLMDLDEPKNSIDIEHKLTIYIRDFYYYTVSGKDGRFVDQRFNKVFL